MVVICGMECINNQPMIKTFFYVLTMQHFLSVSMYVCMSVCVFVCIWMYLTSLSIRPNLEISNFGIWFIMWKMCIRTLNYSNNFFLYQVVALFLFLFKNSLKTIIIIIELKIKSRSTIKITNFFLTYSAMHVCQSFCPTSYPCYNIQV